MAPKHDMKFYAHHFFSTLRIFYDKMATSEREGGRSACIVLVVTGPKNMIGDVFKNCIHVYIVHMHV